MHGLLNVKFEQLEVGVGVRPVIYWVVANHVFLIGQCVQYRKTTVPSNSIILRHWTWFFCILVITLCSTNYKTVIIDTTNFEIVILVFICLHGLRMTM